MLVANSISPLSGILQLLFFSSFFLPSTLLAQLLLSFLNWLGKRMVCLFSDLTRKDQSKQLLARYCHEEQMYFPCPLNPYTVVTLQGWVVQSLIKLPVTQGQREFCFQFCNFLVRCSVYIACPALLSCNNLEPHQTLQVKNIFKQEKIMLQLTFNLGFTLTGFRTTWPSTFVPVL